MYLFSLRTIHHGLINSRGMYACEHQWTLIAKSTFIQLNQVRCFHEGLKANRPQSCNYPPTHTDYKHTDNHLVMAVVALCCTQQSQAPYIDRCVPEI